VVLITLPDQSQHIERLIQSIDFAIRDLLKTENDPLALALYLWTLRQHKLSLINGDDLVRWGTAWIYQAFIEGNVTRRKDEQVTSAALASAALAKVHDLSSIEDQVREKVQQSVSSELSRCAIPYDRPSYGAILLFAATILDVQEPRIGESAKAVISAFREAFPGGRLFGLGFAIQLLQQTRNRELLFIIEQSAYSALEDPRTNYEDQLYLLQALWLLSGETAPSKQLIELTGQILHNSPVWPYLMVGTEEILSAGDGQAIVGVSHLYRSILLDVILKYQQYVDVQAKVSLEAKHRGRSIVRYCAFGFGMVSEGVVWLLLAWAIVPSYSAARRYWLLHEYTAMTSQSALLYLTYVLLAIFILFYSPVFTWTWWSLLIRSKADSDRQIAEILGRSTLKVFLVWLTLIVVAVIIGLFTGVIEPAFQHAVGG
jgi:hypothetical protein